MDGYEPIFDFIRKYKLELVEVAFRKGAVSMDYEIKSTNKTDIEMEMLGFLSLIQKIDPDGNTSYADYNSISIKTETIEIKWEPLFDLKTLTSEVSWVKITIRKTHPLYIIASRKLIFDIPLLEE